MKVFIVSTYKGTRKISAKVKRAKRAIDFMFCFKQTCSYMLLDSVKEKVFIPVTNGHSQKWMKKSIIVASSWLHHTAS